MEVATSSALHKPRSYKQDALTTPVFTRYFLRLRTLWQAGLTNQGHDVRTLAHSMSRPRQRRAYFERRNKELVAQYGYNVPRSVRRRIAWDSLKTGGQ